MSSLSNTFKLSGYLKQSSKFTIQLLILFIIFFFALGAQAKYEGGSGTAGEPYLINTAEQMNEIGANPGDWNKHFILIADVNMSDIAGTEYNIIEDFTGTFDGNDCTISNFSLNSTNQEHTGLFGSVGGEIINLGLLRPNIFAQGRDVGSLIGLLNHGIITNCYARGVVVSGGTNVGGLIGLNTGRVTKCWSSGSVSGDINVGGLTGLTDDGTLKTSYSRANVSGNRNVGGLVGKTADGTSEVTNCYATGSVEGSIISVNVGGLAGQVEQGNAYKCYSTGRVSGGQYVGGLVGRTRVMGIVSRSFWDTETSGQTTSDGGTGKTTVQMQMMNTFLSVGWDFWTIWTICEEMNSPVLIDLIPIGDILCPDGVNFIDYAFFVTKWGQKNCNPANYYCEGTDLDQSGSVDILDLEIFTEHWLEGFD